MHREGDPSSEPVPDTPVAVTHHETGLDEDLGGQRSRQPADEEVRVAGRVPHAERGRGLQVDPSLGQVRPRVLSFLPLAQHHLVELGRLFVRAVQGLAPRGGATFGGCVALVSDGDARFPREVLDRLAETELLDAPEEADGVAALAAPEAVVHALARRDAERRGLLGVERTQTDEPVVARLLEREVSRDELHDVGPLANRLDVFLPDPARHRSGSPCRPGLPIDSPH